MEMCRTHLTFVYFRVDIHSNNQPFSSSKHWTVKFKALDLGRLDEPRVFD